MVVTAVLLGSVLTGAVALIGVRPAVRVRLGRRRGGPGLGGPAVHRLPDRVTFPAYAVCTAAFVVDAVVLDAWGPLLRSLAAAAVALAVAAAAAAVSRRASASATSSSSGCSGSCWAGPAGASSSPGCSWAWSPVPRLAGAPATRRAGWRTALPFGPPLLTAVLALALAGPAPLG